MTKPIKYVVSVVLYQEPGSNTFLVVKRPQDDPELGGVWGLPAVTLQPGELPEEGAARVCKQKLGCRAQSTRFVGAMFQKRKDYDIYMMDIAMALLPDERADVTKSDTTGTIYADQRWTDDPSILQPSAQRGSCCSSVFLTEQGMLDRDDWVLSLEKPTS